MAQETATVYYGAQSLYDFQKEPEWLERTRERFLKTLVEQPDLLESEETVDALGTRIYMKLRLLRDSDLKGPVLTAILAENSEESLRLLALEEDRLSRYRPLYPLMDFFVKDFRKALNPFDFQKIVPYFLIGQLEGFEEFFSLTNEEHYHIAKGILNGIQSNRTYPERSLKAMVKLLGEKYLRAYASMVQQLVTARVEADYAKELRLAKSYVDQAGYLYGAQVSQKADQTLHRAYLSLSSYASCKEDTLIAENRVALASQDTYLSMLPLAMELVDRYERLTINKEGLEKLILSFIQNYGLKSRLYGDEVTAEIRRKWKGFIDERDLSPMVLNAIRSGILDYAAKTPQTVATPAVATPVVVTTKGSVKGSWLEKLRWPTVFIYGVPVLALLLLIAVLPASLKAKGAKALGMKKKALTFYQKASLSKPEVAEYHVQMAILLGLLHREEEAIQEYRIATKILSMTEDDDLPIKRRSSR